MGLFSKKDRGAKVKEDPQTQEEVLYIAEAEVDLKIDKLNFEHEKEVSRLKFEIEKLKEGNQAAIDKAVQKIKDEMRQDAVDSDLARVDAEARLETYEKMDNKDDHEQVMAHLTTLIEALSENIKNPPEVNLPDITVNVPKNG